MAMILRNLRPLRLLLGMLLLGGCVDELSQVSETEVSSTSVGTSGAMLPTATSMTSVQTSVADGTSSTGAATGSTGAATGSDQDCCSEHPDAACEDPEITACVCMQEASCCASAWDAGCVDLAAQCGGCGATTAAETTAGETPACCGQTETPGCPADPGIEACVCALDAFCCDQTWDDACVQVAESQCGAQCGLGVACCTPTDTPGCPQDPVTEACVCALDAFCCDEQWDRGCVGSAQNDCGSSCNVTVGEGDCCMANGTPGCEDADLTLCVCAFDPFCCDAEWDDICVEGAQYGCLEDCGLPPAPPGMGDCCMANGTPGCESADVQNCVCAIDPLCCIDEWNGMCVDEANNSCGGCMGAGTGSSTGGFPPGMGDCCAANGSPGCDDPGIQACVCATLPFCCDVEWVVQCTDEAIGSCMAMCP